MGSITITTADFQKGVLRNIQYFTGRSCIYSVSRSKTDVVIVRGYLNLITKSYPINIIDNN